MNAGSQTTRGPEREESALNLTTEEETEEWDPRILGGATRPGLLESFRSCDLAPGPRLSGDFAKIGEEPVSFGSSFSRRPIPRLQLQACDPLREIHLSRWRQDGGIYGLSAEHLGELRRLRESS